MYFDSKENLIFVHHVHERACYLLRIIIQLQEGMEENKGMEETSLAQECPNYCEI